MWLVCFVAISGSLLDTLSLFTLNACRHSERSPSGLQPLVSRTATSCLSHPGSCSLHLVASCSQGAREGELLVCVHTHTGFLHDSIVCTVPPILILLHPLVQPWHGQSMAATGQQTWGPAGDADVCQRAMRNTGSLLA